MEEIFDIFKPLDNKINHVKKDINKYFNLPIELIDEKTELNKNVREELNLVTKDDEDIYHHVFNCDNEEGNILLEKFSKYTSFDISFIEESQIFYKDIELNELITEESKEHKKDVKIDKWIEFKNQQEFLKKYQYIEFEKLNKLNQQPLFLQLMTLYNLTSPLIQLMLPFIFLLIPFFIIKFTMKIPLNFNTYKTILVKQLSNHSFGKMFIQITNPENLEKKMTASVTIAFYLFSIYQNFLLCHKFYKNIFIIKKFLYDIKIHLEKTKSKIETLNNFIERKKLIKYFFYRGIYPLE